FFPTSDKSRATRRSSPSPPPRLPPGRPRCRRRNPLPPQLQWSGNIVDTRCSNRRRKVALSGPVLSTESRDCRKTRRKHPPEQSRHSAERPSASDELRRHIRPRNWQPTPERTPPSKPRGSVDSTNPCGT